MRFSGQMKRYIEYENRLFFQLKLMGYLGQEWIGCEIFSLPLHPNGDPGSIDAKNEHTTKTSMAIRFVVTSYVFYEWCIYWTLHICLDTKSNPNISPILQYEILSLQC